MEQPSFWRSLSQDRESEKESTRISLSAASSIRYSSNDSLFSHYKNLFDRRDDKVPLPCKTFNSGHWSYSSKRSSNIETLSDISPGLNRSRYSPDFNRKRSKFETSSFRSSYSAYSYENDNKPSYSFDRKESVNSVNSNSSWITTHSSSSSVGGNVSNFAEGRQVERWLHGNNRHKAIRSSVSPEVGLNKAQRCYSVRTEEGSSNLHDIDNRNVKQSPSNRPNPH